MPLPINRRHYTRPALLLVGAIATLGCMVMVGIATLEILVTKHVEPFPLSYGTPTPFPVGVNAFTKTITELPLEQHEYLRTLAQATQTPRPWWQRAIIAFHRQPWYQQVATPVTHSFVIWPGQRREEVVAHISSIVRWDQSEATAFTSILSTSFPELSDGTLFPGRYHTHRFATPDDIATLITERFTAEILARYPAEVAAQVPLDDALIIASLLEREALDFTDMREISGIIWNRLFIDMPLQIDATLQYARASQDDVTNWWPIPRPIDKSLDSPFNTYQNTGLPPGPIGNPSIVAIVAALNPRVTDCLFYFHDRNQNFHCSVTYDEHRTKVQAAYN